MNKDGSRQHPIVSFTFGKTLGWDLLSLYCTTASGSVFTLCPFVPLTAVVPDTLVPMLLASADRLKTERADTSEDSELSQAMGETQSRWLESLQETKVGDSSLVVLRYFALSLSLSLFQRHSLALPLLRYRTSDSQREWTPSPQRLFFVSFLFSFFFFLQK